MVLENYVWILLELDRYVSQKVAYHRVGGQAPIHNGGIFFVRHTPPRLTGLELPYVQRTPQATGGRPPAGPTQRPQPSGHPINSIWAGY